MIVVHCMGGLGNQMFQYAFGRSLARRNHARLLLDLSGYREGGLRRFELDNYAVRYREAGLRDRGRFLDLGRRAALLSAPWRLCDRGGCRVVRERRLGFDPELLQTRGNAYFDGYWQSPRYFEDLGEALRTEFQPREALETREAELKSRIEGVESVAIHIRGGDYRSDPQASSTLGVLSPDYYRSAVARLRERVREPAYFVFSDEPAWARRVLPPLEDALFIPPNREGRSWVDLHLMSRCRHQVIANSSFSWWAAWLNPHRGKIVVAPQRWFRSGEHDTRELYPADWVLVEAHRDEGSTHPAAVDLPRPDPQNAAKSAGASGAGSTVRGPVTKR